VNAHVAHSAASRERLRQLLARLSDEQLAIELHDGWTVSGSLAHLAFWDRFVLARWNHYDREGAMLTLPEPLVDLVNAAALPQWLAIAPRAAAGMALAAAEEVDQRISHLSPAAVEAALQSGRSAMIDRSRHRNAHLDQIEQHVQ
jgi:hypothetical protein